MCYIIHLLLTVRATSAFVQESSSKIYLCISFTMLWDFLKFSEKIFSSDKQNKNAHSTFSSYSRYKRLFRRIAKTFSEKNERYRLRGTDLRLISL